METAMEAGVRLLESEIIQHRIYFNFLEGSTKKCRGALAHLHQVPPSWRTLQAETATDIGTGEISSLTRDSLQVLK